MAATVSAIRAKKQKEVFVELVTKTVDKAFIVKTSIIWQLDPQADC